MPKILPLPQCLTCQDKAFFTWFFRLDADLHLRYLLRLGFLIRDSERHAFRNSTTYALLSTAIGIISNHFFLNTLKHE